MTASKDSVAVGEEFELTIKAELLDIPSNLMFFFEEQKSFSLKVIMPEGFVQTGGDYHDYISGKLTGAAPTVSYTIRGKYNETLTGNYFTLLRGGYNATKADLFTKKQTVCVKSAKANAAYQQYVRNARVAVYSEAPTNKTCGDGINVQNFYVDDPCINRNQVIPFRVKGENTSGSSKKIYVYLCFKDESSIYEHEETVPPGSFSFVINSTIPLAPNCYTTLNNFVHVHYATTRLSTACGGLAGYCASEVVDLNLLSAFNLSPANSVTNVGANVTLATSGCSEQFVTWQGPNNETINGQYYIVVNKQVAGIYT
ncbi:hypothetical protein, partial [Arsenicibacter rosenii]|uniref:hypothetical protein n=1 Tax=Arsenicibacter rosenii TaxID=1750698 RepID=UPI0011605A66